MKQQDICAHTIPELLAIVSDSVTVDGELEHIVREIACDACKHDNRPGNLIRLLTLIRKAQEDEEAGDANLIITKAIDYAYSLTQHNYDASREYTKNLFKQLDKKKGGGND